MCMRQNQKAITIVYNQPHKITDLNKPIRLNPENVSLASGTKSVTKQMGVDGERYIQRWRMIFKRECGVKHLLTWAGSVPVEMDLGGECRIKPHVLMFMYQQVSHGKLQQLQRSHTVKNKDYLTAYDPTVTVPWRTINYTIHPLLGGSHTHSWHSVEIFSSLVLPRKILTRAPKFPVLGLFSTWKEKWDKLKPSKPNFDILASKQWGKGFSFSFKRWNV